MWTGSGNRGGYGHVWNGERLVIASRWAWEFERGPIPDGLLVCHRCDNRRCVRVDHLFLGTHADNTHDMIAKGRAPFTFVTGERPVRDRPVTCRHGHSYADDNTYIRPKGEYECRTCKRATSNKYRR